MKKCRLCKEKFTPRYLTTQPVCNKVSCISEWGKIQRHKRHELARKAQRKDILERKANLKTRQQWIRDTQDNAYAPYIRTRDHDKPCISCGKYDHEIEDVFRGGKWDCGHFKTVGGFPELRFHPMNAHKQCKSCNGGSGKYAKKNETVATQYRVNLIERIGLDMVEWLEGPHQPQKWTIEDLKEIKAYYKEQTKLLKD